MADSKKPGEPVEEERRAQEIHLSQLDDRILCQIDETVIPVSYTHLTLPTIA